MVMLHYCVDLIARCDAALEQLRRPASTSRPNVRQQLLSTLRTTGRPKAKRFKCVWKHKFYCLADVHGTTIPLREYEKDALFTAGLGEKELQFENLDASAEEFRSIMLETFPLLREAGGYQFLKCQANSKTLESLSPLTLSSPGMLKQRVGNARTYIRPLQRDLDITSATNNAPSLDTVS